MSTRRFLLCAAALVGVLAPSCGGNDSAPPSEVTSLRILAVTVADDASYAAPGDTVTFRMTFEDAAGKGADGGARTIEVAWRGGCG